MLELFRLVLDQFQINQPKGNSDFEKTKVEHTKPTKLHGIWSIAKPCLPSWVMRFSCGRIELIKVGDHERKNPLSETKNSFRSVIV